METSLVLGPGHYAPQVLVALRNAHVPYRAARQWPRFEVESSQPGSPPAIVARNVGYDALSRATWGLWRRLPIVGRSEAPHAPLQALFARLAAVALLERDATDLFVAFSQVALEGLIQARKKGARSILEHPTSHVRAWTSDVEEERRRWGSPRVPVYSAWPRSKRFRMEREYAEADRIVVLSSFAKRTFLEAGIPSEKLVTVPLGVDPKQFSPEPRGEHPFRVLFVGRLELMKGLPYLLEAVARLRVVELWLVGKVLPEIESVLARHARVKVRLVDVVTAFELPAIYRECDVLAFPTLNDGFGLVVLEAMASGLPVITTNRCAGADAVIDGVQGYVVPARNAEALADCISRLCDRPREAREMGEQARRRAVEQFTWDHYAARLLVAYGIRPSDLANHGPRPLSSHVERT